MKHWLRMWLAALGVSLLVACGGGDPGKVAETFYKEVMAGDANKAIDLLHLPSEMPAGMGDAEVKGKLNAMFTTIKAQVDKEGGLQSIKAEKTTYTNADKTKADVALVIKPKNGAEIRETLSLIKTEQGWKISME